MERVKEHEVCAKTMPGRYDSAYSCPSNRRGGPHRTDSSSNLHAVTPTTTLTPRHRTTDIVQWDGLYIL